MTVPDPRRDAPPASDLELQQEATVTERDIREDKAWWAQHGSALTQAMLNATEEPG